MEPIHGKDCLLSIKIDGEYYPVLCAVDMTLAEQRRTVLATSATSGMWERNRYVGLKRWNISLSGLTKVDNSDGQVSWFYLLQNGSSALFIQVIFEDVSGEAFVLEGSAIVPDLSINANVNSFASAALEFLGDGAYTLENIIPPPVTPICEVQETIIGRLYEGDIFTSAPELMLSGANVLWVTRGGTGYEETAGTPGDGQFRADYVNGRIYFQASNPGAPGGGEVVLVGWQRTF